MTEEAVRAAVELAIVEVKAETPLLDFAHAHERSIAHRLAVHMESHFGREWNIDCEYDRDGQMKKCLQRISGCDSRKITDEVLPDIIVHCRGGAGRASNLLVVEIKKASADDPCDRKKLCLFTDPGGYYQYKFGLYINVDGGAFRSRWFRDGAPVPGA